VRALLLVLPERSDVVFEDEGRIHATLHAYEAGMDFADGLIIARARGRMLPAGQLRRTAQGPRSPIRR